MATSLAYYRIRADEAGTSHIEELDLSLATKAFAPPAPPMDVSASQPASTWCMLRVDAGWYGDWHPSPARQWLFCLTGQFEMMASDGSRLLATPGTLVLLEDTSGKGHYTRVVGDRPATMAAVQVPK